jgi:cytoskeletal protein CcmA (bactofilin family)
MFEKKITSNPTTAPSVPQPTSAPVTPASAVASANSQSQPTATAPSSPTQAPVTVPQKSTPSNNSAMSSHSRNVLSTDVEVKGTLKFTNDLIVECIVEGEIISQGNLIIGENARISAEIQTGTVVVHGKVNGNITAIDRVDVKSGAEIIGDIKASVLTMEPGAVFVGRSTVGSSPATKAATPATKSL